MQGSAKTSPSPDPTDPPPTSATANPAPVPSRQSSWSRIPCSVPQAAAPNAELHSLTWRERRGETSSRNGCKRIGGKSLLWVSVKEIMAAAVRAAATGPPGAQGVKQRREKRSRETTQGRAATSSGNTQPSPPQLQDRFPLAEPAPNVNQSSVVLFDDADSGCTSSPIREGCHLLLAEET